jgi:hypothetical protein
MGGEEACGGEERPGGGEGRGKAHSNCSLATGTHIVVATV